MTTTTLNQSTLYDTPTLTSIRHHVLNSILIPKKFLSYLSVYKLLYKTPVEFFSHVRNNQFWIGDTPYTIIFNETSFADIKRLDSTAKISISLRQIKETGECIAYTLVSKSVK